MPAGQPGGPDLRVEESVRNVDQARSAREIACKLSKTEIRIRWAAWSRDEIIS